ncbi:hypothetical protein KUTeg_000190 [Tegillarca granosa]|uniref:C1q domain-containing protein n=1 Tax=Tegillarca granosa TaxID=220873 RepID=A0ABQ9FWZ3_TEGGR|nr:hypothetical protein KUTeg_000190 [Tegillarca granosa]
MQEQAHREKQNKENDSKEKLLGTNWDFISDDNLENTAHYKRSWFGIYTGINNASKTAASTTRGVIRFENVITNEGSGYNKDTGKFTAPYGGVYVFSWTIITRQKEAVATELYVNNVLKGRSFSDARDATGNMDDSASNTIVVRMTNINDYATIDDSIPNTEEITDDAIIDNIKSSRNIETENNDDSSDETEPAPKKRPISDVLSACQIITDHLELSDNSSVASSAFDKVAIRCKMVRYSFLVVA